MVMVMNSYPLLGCDIIQSGRCLQTLQIELFIIYLHLNIITHTQYNLKLYSLDIIIGSYHYLRSEVLTSVAMKIPVSWDVSLCNPVDIYQHLGGTYFYN
jgi:hypothetical protein